ncbi:hypothetical protein ACFQ2K_10865 [Streptomyces sanglieri]|uniref:Uncharacterized protein n=1 Tax=Streptomyces sanglieri TaxID=193460 RepID=A0ABW2WUN3_9ACTN
MSNTNRLRELKDGSMASTRSGSSRQFLSCAASRTAGSGSSSSPARWAGVSDSHRQVARIRSSGSSLPAMERKKDSGICRDESSPR